MTRPDTYEKVQVNLYRTTEPALSVEGEQIVPGLAITPALKHNDAYDGSEINPNRWALTHVPSGRTVVSGRCRLHIDQAAAVAGAAAIDWTIPDPKAMAAAIVAAKAMPDIAAVIGRGCPKWKTDCSEPDPPSWSVRCKTCDWVSEEDEDDGPIDGKRARYLADNHECEPWVEICPPGETRWLSPNSVTRDGTLREIDKGQGLRP